MRRPHRHNALFRAACEGLKLFAFMMIGFMAVGLFLLLCGAFEQAEVLVQIAMPFFLRLLVTLVSLMAIAGLFESLE